MSDEPFPLEVELAKPRELFDWKAAERGEIPWPKIPTGDYVDDWDERPLLVAKELTAEDVARIRAKWQARYGGRAVTDLVTPSPTSWRTDER